MFTNFAVGWWGRSIICKHLLPPLYQIGRQTSSTSGRRRSSGIPRSTGTSRETSPNRFGLTPPSRLASARAGMFRPPPPPTVKPVMTEKILKQSQEAESALADALVINSFIL